MKRKNPSYTLLGHVVCMKERIHRKLIPNRMNFVPYSWQLSRELCPCDLDLCDYFNDRKIRRQTVFHFGTGAHHVVGLRNREDGLDNDILAITAAPSEHSEYVRHLIRSPALGAHYKVLFADIYNLNTNLLPTFDLVSLFHLGEFLEPPSPRRQLDDQGVLDLFLARLAPQGRVVFYARSSGRENTQPLIDHAVASGRLSFEERYKSLLVYRASATTSKNAHEVDH